MQSQETKDSFQQSQLKLDCSKLYQQFLEFLDQLSETTRNSSICQLFIEYIYSYFYFKAFSIFELKWILENERQERFFYFSNFFIIIDRLFYSKIENNLQPNQKKLFQQLQELDRVKYQLIFSNVINHKKHFKSNNMNQINELIINFIFENKINLEIIQDHLKIKRAELNKKFQNEIFKCQIINKIIELFNFSIQLALECIAQGHNFNQLLKLTILPEIEKIISDQIWTIRCKDVDEI